EGWDANRQHHQFPAFSTLHQLKNRLSTLTNPKTPGAPSFALLRRVGCKPPAPPSPRLFTLTTPQNTAPPLLPPFTNRGLYSANPSSTPKKQKTPSSKSSNKPANNKVSALPPTSSCPSTSISSPTNPQPAPSPPSSRSSSS